MQDLPVNTPTSSSQRGQNALIANLKSLISPNCARHEADSSNGTVLFCDSLRESVVDSITSKIAYPSLKVQNENTAINLTLL